MIVEFEAMITQQVFVTWGLPKPSNSWENDHLSILIRDQVLTSLCTVPVIDQDPTNTIPETNSEFTPEKDGFQ